MTTRLRVVQADIIKLTTAAIVNAANSSLLGGGGVDGAIHRAAGPKLLEECRAIRARQGGCRPGEAVLTSGGQRGEPALLAACYRNCLRIAAEQEMKSVAFPGISTGIYGYPKAEAAAVAVHEIRQWLAAHEWPHEVVLVAFDDEARVLY